MSAYAAVSRRQFLGTSAATITALLASRLQAGDAAPCQLLAGAATSNITLPLGATNGGVIARGGPATRVHDELLARCLVLDDGKLRLAFAVCDARMIGRDVLDAAKQLLRQSIGLPADQLLISATHTHSAPGVVGLNRNELDRWYLDFFARRVADGICRAAGHLAPARIGWGFGSRPQHVFNRRWRMKPGSIPPDPFGQTTDQVQMNPPAGSPNLVEPAGPVDPQLGVLSVQHADGRPLALLANYGVHYIGGTERNDVSADYYGVFADRVQQLFSADRLDPPFVAIMSNGTSGDVNNIDFRSKRGKETPWTRMRAVAFDLADEALRVCQQIDHRDHVELAVRTTELQLGVRRPDAKRLEWARRTIAAAQPSKNLSRPQIYAQEALELAKYPPTVPVKLQAIRIGPLGIAAIPCEVFAETGLAIKAQSPLKPTFIIELANGFNGYLPTPSQHELGGYETWPARSAYLEPAAEDKIRAGVLNLLANLSMPTANRNKPRAMA